MKSVYKELGREAHGAPDHPQATGSEPLGEAWETALYLPQVILVDDKIFRPLSLELSESLVSPYMVSF